MRTNTPTAHTPNYTHEGAVAARITPVQTLRRSVLACLLWEKEFYEDGASIVTRIGEMIAHVKPETVAALAIEAREQQHLRHVPLLLTSLLSRYAGGKLVEDTVQRVVQRADELSELVAVHAKLNDVLPSAVKKVLPAAMKRGLAKAFLKFDAYALAKYDRAGAVRLRDVLFMTHPKPDTPERDALWKQLVSGTLPAPDTWEVNLSGGANKKETFERLLRSGNLGYLALLRNLRSMVAAGCDLDLVRDAIMARKGAHRVLPFRYVAAARACPQLEPAIDIALSATIAALPVLSGVTVVLVDVSSSMSAKLSEKSDLTRMDAATALASIISGKVRMFSFSDNIVEVPPRRGMAGVDALLKSQLHRGTRLFDAVAAINDTVPYDRIIVITDEQATAAGIHGYYIQGSCKSMPSPRGIGYLINVASAQNGVGYGPWNHIDGFSENIIRYIYEKEKEVVHYD